MKKKTYFKILIILILILGVRFLMSLKDFNRDLVNHMVWTESMFKEGLKGFYSRDYSPWALANYPPLANFLFLFSHKLYLWLNINWQGNNLLASFYKLPLLIADVIIAFCLFAIGKDSGNNKKGVLFALFFLVNLALAYNSVFWGQLESLLTMFCLLSLIFFYKKSKIFAFLFYALALLTKQSALFFLPIFLILVIKKTSLKEKIFGFSLMYFLTVFLFSFFIRKNYFISPFLFYFKTIGGQLHQYLASVNAFNFWFFLGLNKSTDIQIFLSLTYRLWSIILTGFFLTPVLILFYFKSGFKRCLFATMLLSFAVFVFLTRMHERHLYSMFIFLIPFIDSFKKFLIYAAISVIHFLNLYLVWQEFLAEPSVKIVTIGRFLSLFTIIIFAYYYLSYFIKVSKKQL